MSWSFTFVGKSEDVDKQVEKFLSTNLQYYDEDHKKVVCEHLIGIVKHFVSMGKAVYVESNGHFMKNDAYGNVDFKLKVLQL